MILVGIAIGSRSRRRAAGQSGDSAVQHPVSSGQLVLARDDHLACPAERSRYGRGPHSSIHSLGNLLSFRLEFLFSLILSPDPPTEMHATCILHSRANDVIQAKLIVVSEC